MKIGLLSCCKSILLKETYFCWKDISITTKTTVWLNCFATGLIVYSYFCTSLCFQTGALLSAFVQLCHISTPLAEKTWIQLFSRLWKILSDRQQHVRTSLFPTCRFLFVNDCCSRKIYLCSDFAHLLWDICHSQTGECCVPVSIHLLKEIGPFILQREMYLLNGCSLY